MIGNDVVDLQLAKQQSNWQRPGFLEKQFTKSEQTVIANSENPFLQVWLLWSMKEAAYKCYVQQVQTRFFAPLKFVCKLLKNNKGVVFFEDKMFYVKYCLSKMWVYTIASDSKNLNLATTLFFKNKNTSCTKIENQKKGTFFSNNLLIKKNHVGIPYLYRNSKKLPISISKTHHGNFEALVLLPDND